MSQSTQGIKLKALKSELQCNKKTHSKLFWKIPIPIAKTQRGDEWNPIRKGDEWSPISKGENKLKLSFSLLVLTAPFWRQMCVNFPSFTRQRSNTVALDTSEPPGTEFSDGGAVCLEVGTAWHIESLVPQRSPPPLHVPVTHNCVTLELLTNGATNCGSHNPLHRFHNLLQLLPELRKTLVFPHLL